MRIKKVEYVAGYKLRLLFSDKTTKIVDIEPIIRKSKGLFHPLKDINFFKKVSLDDSQYPLSICWPNGADLCPDVLYAMGTEVRRNTKAGHRRTRKTISASSQEHKPSMPIAVKSK